MSTYLTYVLHIYISFFKHMSKYPPRYLGNICLYNLDISHNICNEICLVFKICNISYKICNISLKYVFILFWLQTYVRHDLFVVTYVWYVQDMLWDILWYIWHMLKYLTYVKISYICFTYLHIFFFKHM